MFGRPDGPDAPGRSGAEPPGREHRGGPVGVTVLCPGTFDPVTNGHVDIIERAAQQFDRVVVGVLDNPGKHPLFGVEERVAMLKEATADADGVEVSTFSGLLVEYARQVGARVVVKGLRAVTDFEYEIQMAQMNKRLGGVETFLMTTDPMWSYLSSSLVREIARFGGDVSGLVPPVVAQRLREKFQGV
jgi:pantetheine-phosphate adenylyltransferase